MTALARRRLLLLGCAVGLLAGCGSQPPASVYVGSPEPLVQPLTSISPSPLPATDRAYARAALTPGSLNPAVTQATIATTICKAGWTATVRSVPASVRAAVLAAYGLPAGPFAGELDHEVPLELGGSNDPTNLWPEPGSIPNPKDQVESALKRSVCAFAMPLAMAQQLIVAAYVR